MFAECVKTTIQPATWAVFGLKTDALGAQVSHRGTAFAVDHTGYLLTCWHVTFMDRECQIECDEFEVAQPELGPAKYKAKLIHKERDRDLALLKIESVTTKAVRLLEGRATWGRSCCTFGHPLTVVDVAAKSFRILSSAASGTVSMPLSGSVFPGTRPVLLYELDLFVHGGSSGGAVFLKSGTVFGLVHGYRMLDDGKGGHVRSNLSLAVAITEAVEFLQPFNVKVKLAGS